MSAQSEALALFQRRLNRWIELADRESALTEILYDGDGRTVIDIGGELIADEDADLDDTKVLNLGHNAAVYARQVFSPENPFVSVIIPPDWRVSFMRPPVVEFPIMAMRKLRRRPVPLSAWVWGGELAEESNVGEVMPGGMRERLEWAVSTRKTVAISGEVGTGKTTLMRAALGLVPSGERIVTIEDPRELMLTEPDGVTRRRNYVALEAKPQVMSMADLLRATLRLRPDRIIIGEVRGSETLELVRSLNTGHSGSLFTVHSKGRRDAIERLHTLTVEAQPGYTRESVDRAIDLVVQIVGRGDRRHIAEVWRNA